MNTLKCVTANCPTKTDFGPFLSLSFFENKDQFLHDEVSSSVSQLATKVITCSLEV